MKLNHSSLQKTKTKILTRTLGNKLTKTNYLDSLYKTIIVSENLPLLSSLAVDMLCIPASSAPVECTFSIAGESTSGRRSCLSDKHLQREVLIQKTGTICDCVTLSVVFELKLISTPSPPVITITKTIEV